MQELLFKDESYAIMGACFEVYNQLGPGFLEGVYHEALEIELAERGIPHLSKAPLTVNYKGRVLQTPYVADFVCYERIVLEIKAARELAPKHEAQTIHYLVATGLTLGILINFGHYPDLQSKRFARSEGVRRKNS